MCCLRTIRYGLGRCFWGELYTHTSSDKGSSRQPWPLCCLTRPYSQPPPPTHQHQPRPLTHSIGPRCAFGNTCHVPGLLHIPLDYPSQVLCRHSDPRPCHSVTLPDSLTHPHSPSCHVHILVYCLRCYHTVWPWPMLLGRALYPAKLRQRFISSALAPLLPHTPLLPAPHNHSPPSAAATNALNWSKMRMR